MSSVKLVFSDFGWDASFLTLGILIGDQNIVTLYHPHGLTTASSYY
ncbi:MAG: hypothetical protein LHW48_04705 [Candidatus Cloacimonetes bacterium]|nr:hypothetical protein [Candidatus Cloacimonadota bacterium]